MERVGTGRNGPFRLVPSRSVPFRPVPTRSVPFRPVPSRSVPLHPVTSVPFRRPDALELGSGSSLHLALAPNLGLGLARSPKGLWTIKALGRDRSEKAETKSIFFEKKDARAKIKFGNPLYTDGPDLFFWNRAAEPNPVAVATWVPIGWVVRRGEGEGEGEGVDFS